MSDAALEFLAAGWAAPQNLRAGATTRRGGCSRAPYASLNLAAHVGDEAGAVTRNRDRLEQALSLPCEPYWLDQVHGDAVVFAAGPTTLPRADAAWTDVPGTVLAILTADCLPVLFWGGADPHHAQVVAAAHAGWRGLAAGVLANTVAALPVPPSQVRAWIGPAISAPHYEVGTEVRAALLDSGAPREAFTGTRPGHWLADLPRCAEATLRAVGVVTVAFSGLCTARLSPQFFSYRREGVCGRTASLVWMTAPRAVAGLTDTTP